MWRWSVASPAYIRGAAYSQGYIADEQNGGRCHIYTACYGRLVLRVRATSQFTGVIRRVTEMSGMETSRAMDSKVR